MQEKEFLTELEMSALIGRSVQTLRNDRFNKRGLPYVKFSRQVRYPAALIREFVNAHTVFPEDGEAGHASK